MVTGQFATPSGTSQGRRCPQGAPEASAQASLSRAQGCHEGENALRDATGALAQAPSGVTQRQDALREAPSCDTTRQPKVTVIVGTHKLDILEGASFRPWWALRASAKGNMP